ncbi:MAG: hypothetical protein ACRENB_08600 [Gemmatimonadales bacterium]
MSDLPSTAATRPRGAALARQGVARRLAAREEMTLADLVRASRAAPLAAARRLLAVLAGTLGVPVGRLRPEDSLEALFDVPEAPETLSTELLQELRQITNRGSWERMAATITPSPRTDRDWLDVQLGLRVQEWVRTWAPEVRPTAGIASDGDAD